MHKTNCMQSIENISTWEVFSSICPYFKKNLECERGHLRQFWIHIPLEPQYSLIIN